MTIEELEQLKYPIGKFQAISEWNDVSIKKYGTTIETFPQLLKSEVSALSTSDLEKKYRPDGWNIAQVVNHCADSHINAFIRFKLSLTETNPSIKPYHEAAWAELKDGTNLDISLSLQLIESLHAKWMIVLNAMKMDDFGHTYFHPEYQRNYTLANALATYDWHCRHHLAHIKQALKNAF
jgi:DinB superfamily